MSKSKSEALLLTFTVALTGLSSTSLLQVPQIAHSQENFEEYLIIETKNEQKINQKNIGSGSSTNINCSQNLIGSTSNLDCPGVFPPGPPVDNCVTDIEQSVINIPVGRLPIRITYASIDNRVFVTNAVSDTVSVIDACTLKVIDTLSTENNPFGITYDSINNRVYVTNQASDTVSVIDELL